MGNRGIRDLEKRQENGRGALTRGAWLWVERAGGGLVAVETSALPRSAGEKLATHDFEFNPKTGRCFALVPAGDALALRRIAATALAILVEELP